MVIRLFTGVPRRKDNMKNTEKSMETLVNLCKSRGFVYAGSEIYGGLANTWDYGPLGVELKTTSSAPGGRNSFRKIPITSGRMPPS